MSLGKAMIHARKQKSIARAASGGEAREHLAAQSSLILQSPARGGGASFAGDRRSKPGTSVAADPETFCLT